MAPAFIAETQAFWDHSQVDIERQHAGLKFLAARKSTAAWMGRLEAQNRFAVFFWGGNRTRPVDHNQNTLAAWGRQGGGQPGT